MRTIPILCSCAAFVATAAFAHQNVQNEHVRARMAHMKIIADDTKVLGSMAKGQMAFDPTSANQALAAIAVQAVKIPDYFQEPADDPKSEARPDIWDNWERFSDLSVELAHASQTEITTPEDLRPALAEIGAACRACHESYRD